jgi:histidinol-phosphate phosphatase family protein
MNKAIFIDKDGTLIHDIPYNVDPNLVRFEDTALESVSLLQQLGYLIIIVSNQPGVALKYFEEKDLKKVEEKINHVLHEKNAVLNGFYYCPHSPESQCHCRKPAPGLLLKAASDLEVDLSRSWMIGDILNDVEAGKRSGSKTILINNGNETEWELNAFRSPDFTAKNMKEASEIIMAQDG